MTEEQALKLLEYWKKKLKLQDYNIELKIEVDLGSDRGRCYWKTTLKFAEILMAKHDSIKVFEETLVHELLHAKFDLVQDIVDKVSFIVLHQHIETLAVALVDLKYCSKEV